MDWSLSRAVAGLSELWRQTAGDPEICVAVLDGPADLSHPCFQDASLTVLGTQSPGGAAIRHGTMVSSILFGSHGSTVWGMAPSCRGIIIPIFEDGDGGEIRPCSQIDLARGIDQAIEAGANVINVSGGQIQSSGGIHPLLAHSIEVCQRKDILIVASTGNDGCDCLHVPAAHPSVLAVGAMDTTGKPLEWSNWGEHYSRQGILAPGAEIPAAVPGGGRVLASGTSFATPVVSGAAALLLSLQRRSGRGGGAHAVRSALLESAIGCSDLDAEFCDRLLAGRLNLNGAQALLKKGTIVAMPDQDSATLQALADLPPAPAIAEAAIRPATCGCQSGNTASEGAPSSGLQMVYALGRLGYDFGTEARRDSIHQQMGLNKNPYAPQDVLNHLDKNPSDAADLIWTLDLDGTPIYAIQPQGAFAEQGYLRLRQFLAEQVGEGVERVSIPGWIVGKRMLLNGQTVPVIQPALRGMWNWTIKALVRVAAGEPPAKNASEKDKAAYRQKTDALSNFLRRVYDELRNLGITSRDRALNFSATNALVVANIFESAVTQGMELDSIAVDSSPISRPGSDCWDVKLTFFDPARVFERARKVYASTVDVSDPVPVMIGDVRSWSVR